MTRFCSTGTTRFGDGKGAEAGAYCNCGHVNLKVNVFGSEASVDVRGLLRRLCAQCSASEMGLALKLTHAVGSCVPQNRTAAISVDKPQDNVTTEVTTSPCRAFCPPLVPASNVAADV